MSDKPRPDGMSDALYEVWKGIVPGPDYAGNLKADRDAALGALSKAQARIRELEARHHAPDPGVQSAEGVWGAVGRIVSDLETRHFSTVRERRVVVAVGEEDLRAILHALSEGGPIVEALTPFDVPVSASLPDVSLSLSAFHRAGEYRRVRAVLADLLGPRSED